MSKPTINGKKPLSAKVKQASIEVPEEFGNMLSLPDEIKAELAAKGLKPRWINATKLRNSGGYHEKGWVPYKHSGTITSSDTLKFGNDPDGIIRRGDAILAVKTDAQVGKHRAYLDAKANRAKTVNAQKAQELRRMIAESDVVKGSAEVFEGYEENE